MDLFSAILLGIVQGVSEWLPISSKTLDAFVFLQFLGGSAQEVIPILLYLHLGTLFSAIIYFRKKIMQIILEFAKIRSIGQFKKSQASFYFFALLGTGIVGIPLLVLQKLYFSSLEAGALYAIMGIGLLLTAALLYLQKKKAHSASGLHKQKNTINGEKWAKSPAKCAKEATIKDGIFTGLFQGLSVLGGLSRSGTTTTALVFAKFEPKAVFELSFILSIPTIMCAEVLFYILDGSFASFDISQGAALALSSFVFGYLTIDALIRLAQRINLAALAAIFGILMVLAGLLQLS
ncbi:hypothetical protein COU37_04980 [Candidatus Micrarchaeota archaeon CG10_big_fil_rev_8_21_14_0_10_45_29]|nr:MAG: hypothetical protein COU37_04980 [Candidatus Micrarchaeota archaeon CG10_big_fil_rev_8_21_14_0_10_45_29]